MFISGGKTMKPAIVMLGLSMLAALPQRAMAGARMQQEYRGLLAAREQTRRGRAG
jgi:hypothetical protein